MFCRGGPCGLGCNMGSRRAGCRPLPRNNGPDRCLYCQKVLNDRRMPRHSPNQHPLLHGAPARKQVGPDVFSGASALPRARCRAPYTVCAICLVGAGGGLRHSWFALSWFPHQVVQVVPHATPLGRDDASMTKLSALRLFFVSVSAIALSACSKPPAASQSCTYLADPSCMRYTAPSLRDGGTRDT